MVHLHLQPNPRMFRGQMIECKAYAEYHADVKTGRSIRISGGSDNTGRFDITFHLGDEAIYDSYNFVYTGKILKITDNTITIDASGTGRSPKRFTLYDFCQWNRNFDAAHIAMHNHEESYCI